MEEISWGQRLLGVRTPEFLGLVNVQNEINLHNISGIIPFSTVNVLAAAGCIFFGVLVPLAAKISPRVQAFIERTNFAPPPLFLVPIFAAAGCLLVFSPVHKSSEVGELLLGLSLGAMAADHAMSLLVRRESGCAPGRHFWMCAAAALVAAVVAVHWLLPLLIASAYQGESLAVLNSLIGDAGAHTLQYYLDKGSRFGWGAIGLAVIVTALSIPFVSQSRQQTRAMRSAAAAAIPVLWVGSILLGMSLTAVGGSPNYFKTRLFVMAHVFSDFGLHNQSLEMSEYLERTADVLSGQILAVKGFALLNLQRREEAVSVLQNALARDLERHLSVPTDTSVLDRIARVHDRLGDKSTALSYWQKSLSVQDELLGATTSAKEQTSIHFNRAYTYEEMGEKNRAIDEFLRAGDSANAAVITRTKRGVIRVLATCTTMADGIELVDPERMDPMIASMLERLKSQSDYQEWCR